MLTYSLTPPGLGGRVFFYTNNTAEVLGSLLNFNPQKPQKPIHFWKEEILSFNILHKNIEYHFHRKYEKS